MSQSPTKVLLVEDDPEMPEVLAAILMEDGIALTASQTVTDAWNKITTTPFDLVLLDLGLPGADGFELLRQIKQTPETARLPVIIVTAWSSTSDKLRGFELGAADYLTKPFESSELRARAGCVLRSRRIQEQLTRMNQELAAARSAAESSSLVKANFLANMSHEIRTPMNGVIAMTSLLLETQLTPDQRSYVETIHSSSEALLEIINDILDLSKIESGKLEVESIAMSLQTCVEESLDLLATKAVEKRIELACHIENEIPARLLGDPSRLRQILVNLIGNGVKFTNHGEVVVEVSVIASPDEQKRLDAPWILHFAVCDTGIGIPAERLSRLFKSFTQSDASTSRKFGGTGLGLAISKRLVELMGGKMWVESTPDKGSTFHFSIPFPEIPSGEQERRSMHNSGLAGLRVLIVDDNATCCRILGDLAVRWGMKPQCTQDPWQALEWLRNGERFDLAILDYQLQETTAKWVADEFRKLPASARLPIVALPPIGMTCSSDDIAKAHFDGCVTKPVKAESLRVAMVRVAPGSHPHKIPASNPAGTKLDPTLSARIPLRIMVCDDNAINQKVAQRILQQLGYTAAITSNGKEALSAMDGERFDLVFMDLQMPEMNGIEATRIIRERQRTTSRFPNLTPPLIIVAMTASAMVGDRDKCLASGMDDYVAKPVRPEDVRNAIERWGAYILETRSGGATDSASNGEKLMKPIMPNSAKAPPPVDMDRLMEFSDGTVESLRELVALYLDQTEKQLRQLRSAVQAGDESEIRRVAHSSAGANATCGVRNLAALLRELEHLGMAGHLESAAGLCDQCDVEFIRVRKALDDLLGAPAAPRPEKKP